MFYTKDFNSMASNEAALNAGIGCSGSLLGPLTGSMWADGLGNEPGKIGMGAPIPSGTAPDPYLVALGHWGTPGG